MPDVTVEVSQNNVSVTSNSQNVTVAPTINNVAVNPLNQSVNVTPTIQNVTVEMTLIGNSGLVKESFVTEKFTGLSGTHQQCDLIHTFRANSLAVFYNGVLMEKDIDYAEDPLHKYFIILINVSTTDKFEARYVVD